MKLSLFILALVLPSISMAAKEPQLSAQAPLVYLNQHIGFNVTGYKYSQAEFPCNIDKMLVESLIKRAKKSDIRLEAVATHDKIQNGVIPVVAIDIEQLVLGDKNRQFGIKQNSSLPKVQITAALIKNENIVTAKHTCAIMSLNEFTPASNVMDMGTYGVSVCDATRKCLKDLSKDVIAWVAPQLN